MIKSDCYTFYQGNSPLLVSIPHDGRILPTDIANLMTSDALSLPDTDWNVSRLYQFCKEIDASMIIAKYSRYVVDLNRSDMMNCCIKITSLLESALQILLTVMISIKITK